MCTHDHWLSWQALGTVSCDKNENCTSLCKEAALGVSAQVNSSSYSSAYALDCLMKVNDPPSILCRLLLDVSRRLEDARQWVLWVQSVQGEPWHRQPESASPGQGGPQEVLVLLWEGRCLIISLPFQNRFFLWPAKVRSLGCHVHMEATEWSSCTCLLSLLANVAFQSYRTTAQGRTPGITLAEGWIVVSLFRKTETSVGMAYQPGCLS